MLAKLRFDHDPSKRQNTLSKFLKQLGPKLTTSLTTFQAKVYGSSKV